VPSYLPPWTRCSSPTGQIVPQKVFSPAVQLPVPQQSNQDKQVLPTGRVPTELLIAQLVDFLGYWTVILLFGPLDHWTD